MFYYTFAVSCGTFIFALLVRKKIANPGILAGWNFVITCIYLIWRFTVVPVGTIIGFLLGCLLLGAELLMMFQFSFSQWLLTKKYQPHKKTLEDIDGSVPTVDIFICTLNEPKELVETTVLAALNLEYPFNQVHIFICDDGHRDSIRGLAKSLGVGYLTREGNEGAKAGNINNALMNTSGDLFVVLDADMICMKDFLKKTVGYFVNSNTAFVQTPQVYYNKDMYQRNLGKEIPNEQDFFMREMQEALASVNAVLHVGTNAVFRRDAVMKIGMYPTTTITEDMAVGMLLQAEGYDSIFINEVLVLGLTASTYTDLVIQRDRWCRGNIQTTKEFHPLKNKGLNIVQKLAYLNGMLYWYTGFAKMIFTICPIWFLITATQSIRAEFEGLLVFFLPLFIGQVVTFNTLVSNTRSLKWAHYYDIAMAPHMCSSVLKEFFSADLKFKVTPKEMRDDKSFFQTQVIVPHLILIFITIASWLIGGALFYYGRITFLPFAINLLWTCYNFWGFVLCVRVAYHIGGVEHQEGVSVNGGQKLTVHRGGEACAATLTELYQEGMRLQSDYPLSTGDAVISLDYGGRNVLIQGWLECEGMEIIFTYKTLNLEQKRAVVGIYVDHLEPSFNVEKQMRYR